MPLSNARRASLSVIFGLFSSISFGQDLSVVEDTFTNTRAVSRNYGDNSDVRVSTWGDRHGFFRFQDPGSGTVTAARLNLRVKQVTNPGIINVHVVQGAWSESALTANTFPTIDPVPIASFPVAGSDDGTTVSVDILDAVDSWVVSPVSNFGVALAASDAESVSVYFFSGESGRPATLTLSRTGGTNSPPTANDDRYDINQPANNVLLNVLANDTDPDMPADVLQISSVGSTSNGGTVVNNTGSLSYTPSAGFDGTESFDYTIADSAGAESSATVSVGVSVTPQSTGEDVTLNVLQDAFVNARRATRNYGSDRDIRVSTWGPRAGYLMFDTSGLGDGSQPYATLYLTVTEVSNPGFIDLHLIQDTWSESGVTTNVAPTMDPFPLTSFYVDAGDVGRRIAVDVRPVVQAWAANPGSAFGIALVDSAAETVSAFFRSSEGGGPATIELTSTPGSDGDGGGGTGGGTGGGSGGGAKTWRIMPLGDSITEATGSRNSYRRPLWHSLTNAGYTIDFVGSKSGNRDGAVPNPDFDTDHEGHSGWRADRFLANTRIRRWARDFDPEIVLLHLGTNDIFQEQSVSSTIDEIDEIIDEIRVSQSNVVILLAQIIPHASPNRDPIEPLNAAIPALVASKNTSQSPVILVNQYAGFNARADTYDTVHPNLTGENKMAQIWFDALLPYLTE